METEQPQKLITAAVLALMVTTMAASAQKADVPPSDTTPDTVETRMGMLDFKDGMPSKATLAKVYDNLDFVHGLTLL